MAGDQPFDWLSFGHPDILPIGMSREDSLATVTNQPLAGARAQVVEVPGYRLSVIAGPDKGHTWILARNPQTIGKSPDCAIQLRDPSVSRQHAVLTHAAKGLVVRDLGSTNGTWVKGVQTVESILRPGDEFRVADTTLKIEAVSEVYRALIPESQGLGPLVGGTKAMREVYGLITAVAPSMLNVLVTGETGTGKELVARALHEASGRKGAYRIFDCGNTSHEMIRSELFGHEKGAYTGAVKDRRGAFREADGGTLFLDEIGELPLDLQPSLLRVLETGMVMPVGGDRETKVDVRLVAATNRDLRDEVRRGAFREDLYYRLAVLAIRLPALRERREDIPLILKHMLEALGSAVSFTPAAQEAINGHDWPGNVRALRNFAQRIAVLRKGQEATVEDLDLPVAVSGPPAPGPGAAPGAPGVAGLGPNASLDDMERLAITQALERFKGDRLKVAAELGISLATLKRRLKKYSEED